MDGRINHDRSEQTQKRDFCGSLYDQQYLADSQSLPDISAHKRRRIREAYAVGQIPAKLATDEGLCSDCTKLDFQGLIQKAIELGERGPLAERPDERQDILVADVGHRYRKRQETGCTLCQMLAASPDNGDEIRATLFLHRFHLGSFSKIRKESKALCLIVVPRSFSRNYVYDESPNSIQQLVRSKGCAVILQDEDRPSMFVPQVVPPLFDARTVTSWLHYCRRHHKLLCGLGSVPISGFQVIDCENLSVEEGKPGTPYVALSYVWGETPFGTPRHLDGRRLLPTQLSQVILDSIDVTRTLGYRYLWIDKFCIDQDNPSAKHHQIQNMDAVYQNAELTLIAAAGRDETYGLPGVGTKPRSRQPVLRKHGVTVIWSMRDPHQSINSSHWSTRGWTFQEAILSPRRLVFTDEQVYFECRTMNCFESLYSPLDRLHIKRKSKTYEDLRGGVFSGNRGYRFGKPETFSQYLWNVEEYSSRTLRYDEDALRAFQGIIRRFSRQARPLGNVWGLAYAHNSDLGLSYFVYSLTWSHETRSIRSRRRNDFPSWTWVGWEGRAQYKPVSREKLRFDNRVKSLSFENSAGDVVEFKDLTTSYQENCTYPIIHITAPVVPARLISYHPDPNHRKWPWIIGKRQRAELSLSSHDVKSDVQLAENLQDISRWRCVYLGGLPQTGFIVVLKLDSGADIFVRAEIEPIYDLHNQLASSEGRH
ncbi:heterokaryon incompatibility protein-domain-containing protein [Poronia punctata]|nr:heterokaryon incompatibility protein-domain-containing protein [Poronia punctata]